MRVFVSGTSSIFRTHREAIKDHLRRKGFDPIEQGDFSATYETITEMLAPTRRRSSFILSIQASLHALVFLDSQAMIPTDCPNSLRTSWMRSAHLMPFSTSEITS